MISEHADPVARLGSKETGGQNVYVYNLAKQLGALGWEVDVFTRLDSANEQRVVRFARRCRVIRVASGPKRYVPRDHLFQYLPDFVDGIVSFKKAHNLSYDIIHAHYWMSGWSGLKLKKLWEIPLVGTYHSLGYIRYHSLKEHKEQKIDSEFFRFRIKWEKQLAREADLVITTSPYEKEDLAKYYDATSANLVVVPAGINPASFHPINQTIARKHLGLDPVKKVVLYVGRLEWRKGIGTLIAAFAKLAKTTEKDSAVLIIVGRTDGNEANEVSRLKKLAHDLGIASLVRFVGSKEKKQVRLFYSAANVCAVPSYYEPFGIVPLEALACGTPVVASSVGGLQMTSVDGTTGHLVAPRTPELLAAALKDVLDNETTYRK